MKRNTFQTLAEEKKTKVIVVCASFLLPITNTPARTNCRGRKQSTKTRLTVFKSMLIPKYRRSVLKPNNAVPYLAGALITQFSAQ